MKDFRLAALSVSISYGIFECEILTLGKLVFFIASCTLCTAEVESGRGTEGRRDEGLTGGRPPGRQPSWTTGDGLRITERTTTVLNI
jgi:hypothetical protein